MHGLETIKKLNQTKNLPSQKEEGDESRRELFRRVNLFQDDGVKGPEPPPEYQEIVAYHSFNAFRRQDAETDQ